MRSDGLDLANPERQAVQEKLERADKGGRRTAVQRHVRDLSEAIGATSNVPRGRVPAPCPGWP